MLGSRLPLATREWNEGDEHVRGRGGREATMNKKAQINRMLSLVSPMALRAIELPPEARDRFIENEVAGLRKTFEYGYP